MQALSMFTLLKTKKKKNSSSFLQIHEARRQYPTSGSRMAEQNGDDLLILYTECKMSQGQVRASTSSSSLAVPESDGKGRQGRRRGDRKQQGGHSCREISFVRWMLTWGYWVMSSFQRTRPLEGECLRSKQATRNAEISSGIDFFFLKDLAFL